MLKPAKGRFQITNQLLYQLSYAGIYEGKPSILIHFFRPLYPPFVSLRQKRAQRADFVPLPLRTVRIPSEEASPFIKLARLRTLIDAGWGGGLIRFESFAPTPGQPGPNFDSMRTR